MNNWEGLNGGGGEWKNSQKVSKFDENESHRYKKFDKNQELPNYLI